MRFGTKHGAYSLTTLPGSPQVVVSHAAFVDESHRGKGLGKADHIERLKKMTELGYDFAICTVDTANNAQRKILRDCGWSVINRCFRSSSSGHIIELWVRDVPRKSEVYDQII